MANIDKESIVKELPGDGRIRKTRIVCTMGAASRSVPLMEMLLRDGMNVARFDFSHHCCYFHQETLKMLKQAMSNTRIRCALMLDTQGPKIRTGRLKDGKKVQLTKGLEITLTTDRSFIGHEYMISVDYKKLAEVVKPGNRILLADGAITLTVLSCDLTAGRVTCLVKNTAMLGEREYVRLPGIRVDLPTLTTKDKEDILEWAVPNDIDMIALSFVRKGSDVATARQILARHGIHYIKLMSKVENLEGVTNFDEILLESDGLMISRGDLRVEIPAEKIFLAQKMMIYKCNVAGKPVVTAGQMLESMIKSPRPTCAHVSDVATAVIDGTDCVMLTGGTASGDYPEMVVKSMARICIEAESLLDYRATFEEISRATHGSRSQVESSVAAAVESAFEKEAKLIVVLTNDGTIGRLVAMYRPQVSILLVGWSFSYEYTARGSLFHRGLIPINAETTVKATDVEESVEDIALMQPIDAEESVEVILESALKQAIQKRLCQRGDCVVALHCIGRAEPTIIIHNVS